MAESGWEYLLWRSGALDRLPSGVAHALVDAWVEGDTTVIVMRDLGDAVLTWADRLSRHRAHWVIERIGALHRQFLGHPPEGLAPLDLVLSVFSPRRIRTLAASGNELMELAQRGWEIFDRLVPADVAAPCSRSLTTSARWRRRWSRVR